MFTYDNFDVQYYEVVKWKFAVVSMINDFEFRLLKSDFQNCNNHLMETWIGCLYYIRILKAMWVAVEYSCKKSWFFNKAFALLLF